MWRILLFSYSILKKSQYITCTAARNLCPWNLLVKFYYKIKQPAYSNPRFCCWNRDLSVLLCHWFNRNISNPPKWFFFWKLICNLRIILSKLLDRVLCYALNLCFLYHLASGLNSNTTKVQTNVMWKNDNINTIITSVALLL